MIDMSDDFPLALERESSHRLPNGQDVMIPENCPPVAVAFGNHFEKDSEATAQAGRDVYREVVFVKIAIPGDKNSLYFQPASDLHKVRFPKAWDNFQKRTSSANGRVGTPIETWAPISKAVALTLRAAHIHTVEDLATVHDGHIDKIGIDGRGLRAKAQAFIQSASDGAALIKEAEEKKALQDQIAALQAQITALSQSKSDDDSSVEDVVASARRPRQRA